jgi:hypothetical protein
MEATKDLDKPKIKAFEAVSNAAKISPSYDEYGIGVGFRATGPSLNTNTDANYDVRVDPSEKNEQLNVLSSTKIGKTLDTITRAVLTGITGNDYKQTSQDIQEQLNAHYGDQDLVFWYDRQRDTSSTSTDFTDNFTDYAHAYVRLTGTTWVEVKFND